MFRVKSGQNEVPVTKLIIDHREEELPQILLTLPASCRVDTLELLYAGEVIAKGRAQVKMSDASLQEVLLQYERPAEPAPYDPNLQRDHHYRDLCMSRFQVLNHSLLDGSYLECDLFSETPDSILVKECIQIVETSKLHFKKAARVEVETRWTHEDVGCMNLGRDIASALALPEEFARKYFGSSLNLPSDLPESLIFRTYLPLQFLRYVQRLERRGVKDHTWISQNRCRPLELFWEASGDEKLGRCGMWIVSDLTLSWKHRAPVQESLFATLCGPLTPSEDIDKLQPEEVEKMRFILLPPPASVSLWASNTPYSLGEKVFVGGQVYKCLQEHKSSDSFPDLQWEPLWQATEEGSNREGCYLTSPEGHRSLKHLFGIVGGHLLRQLRNKRTVCLLPVTYLKRIALGKHLKLKEKGISGMVAAYRLEYSFNKSRLCVELLSLEHKPSEAQDSVSKGYVENLYVSDDYVEREVVTLAAGGLKISAPVPTSDTRFFLTRAVVKRTIEGGQEEILVDLPRYVAPSKIVHKVEVEWAR